MIYQEKRNGYWFTHNINRQDYYNIFPYMIHIYKLTPNSYRCVYYKSLKRKLSERACKVRFTKFLKEVEK